MNRTEKENTNEQLKQVGLTLSRISNKTKMRDFNRKRDLSVIAKEPLTNVPSRRKSKAGKKTARIMRNKHSLSMLDMGAPARHFPVPAFNDERTKVLFSAYKRRLENRKDRK